MILINMTKLNMRQDENYWQSLSQSNIEFGKRYAKSLAQYAAFGIPDILIGSIPLYNVQIYNVSRSQDELKFRSAGTQYLGDQEGKHSGVRIDCILIGPLRTIILTALEAMYLYNRGKITQKEFNTITTRQNIKTTFMRTYDNTPVNPHDLMTSQTVLDNFSKPRITFGMDHIVVRIY